MYPTLPKQLILAAAILAAGACGSDSMGPAGESAAGNYTAISFVTTGTSGQRDELAAGSTMQVNLATDGTTTGHLHVAATNTDPAFDVDLAGTWKQVGNVITFAQSADSFVRDLQFTLVQDLVNGWTLVGNQTLSGTNVKLTLKRSS